MKQNPSNLKPGDGLVLGQPFDPQVSANYRIPGLVYHNGMLVASADVRWDQEKDGGGLDVVRKRFLSAKSGVFCGKRRSFFTPRGTRACNFLTGSGKDDGTWRGGWRWMRH